MPQRNAPLKITVFVFGAAHKIKYDMIFINNPTVESDLILCSFPPSHYKITLSSLFINVDCQYHIPPRQGVGGVGRINMDQDTLKDDTRAEWGQLTDYDQPVTDGMEEGLVDFYKKRYIKEEMN